MTTPPYVLAAEGISKAYRRHAVLRNLSLRVRAGEAVALAGPNGAGKSTLLGCLTAERLPDAGEIRVCGADPFSDPAAVARCMGFVPEQPFLYGELTVGETLRFVREARGLDRTRSDEEVRRLLSLLGLADAEGTLCRELSQGMARKVAVVAALLHQPRLLLFDEVFNGLDHPSTERLLGEIARRREDGTAVLLSSHDLGLLARSCDRGLLLAPGAWNTLDGEQWERWRTAPSLAADLAPGGS